MIPESARLSSAGLQVAVKTLIRSCVLLPFFWAPVLSGSEVAYVSIELGTLPGDTTSTAVGINQLGQVVGVSMNGNASHAFIYADGVMKALPALPDHPFDTASSINDYGQTVGVAYHVPAGPDLDAHGFIYANGVISDIGSLTGTNGSSVAASVNNSGQVTGTSSAPGGGEYAFIYSNGIMTSLGTLPGDSNSIGAAVNASGGVTGGSANGAHEQAFIYINGVMTAIGPGNLNSVGTAISASGQIAGYLWKCCYTAHAFLYSSGIFADLGTLPGDMDSYAEGMNDAGQVTGHSDSSTASRAFLYSNSVMMDLNSLINPGLGITLTDAGAINNSGEIAATGIDAAGRRQAFLLTPAPEPSTFLLLGGALCALARKRIFGAASVLSRVRQLF